MATSSRPASAAAMPDRPGTLRATTTKGFVALATFLGTLAGANAVAVEAAEAADYAAPKEIASLPLAYPEVRPVNLASRLGKDRWLYPLDITTEGRIIGIAIDQRHVDRELVEYQPDTQASRTLFVSNKQANADPHAVQIGSAVSAGASVVFTLENDEGDVWTLYALDRNSGQLRSLAHNSSVDGKPCPAAVSAPAIANDTVYWSACGASKGAIELNAYSVPLSGGKVSLLRSASATPQIVHAHALTLRVPDPQDPEVGSIAQLSTAAGASATVKMLTHGPVMTYGAGPRLLVWTTPELDRIHLRSRLDPDAEHTPVDTSLPAVTPVDPVVWEDYAAWQQDDGPRLYDAQRHIVVRLADKLDRPRLSNGYLLWGESPGEPSVHALFTRTYHLVRIADLDRAAKP